MALLALALQLALSFGHSHPIASPSAGITAASIVSHGPGGPDGLATDDCDICATIALISTTSRLGSGPATEQAKLLFETVRQLSSELGHADPVWASSAG